MALSLGCCFGICWCCCKDNYAEFQTSSSHEEFRNLTVGSGMISDNRRNCSGERESLLQERRGNRFEIFHRKRNPYGSADKHVDARTKETPNLFGSMNRKKSLGSKERKVRFTFSGTVAGEPNDNGSSGYLTEEEPKAEEQRLLDQIVEETAANMIDVKGFNYGSLSRSQTRLKSQWYNQRLNCIQVSSIIVMMLKPKPHLLLDLLNTKKCRSYVKSLHQQVISQKDVNLMSWAASEIAEGLQSIRIEENRTEAFVIPFPVITDPFAEHQVPVASSSESESY